MKKILIIEDDPIIAHVYRTRLEREKYSVETCNDGQIALERVPGFKPNAILLDLMLPKMNGIEFLKRIRAERRFAGIPVLVFTNAYLPNMIEEAIAAGASEVFNKATLTPKQLLDCLHFLIFGKNRAGDAPTSLGGTAFIRKPPPVSVGEHPGSPPPPSNYGYNNDYKENPTPASGRLDPSFFDSEFYKAFVTGKSETMADLRASTQSFIKATDETVRDQRVVELYRKVHALTARAGLAKFADIAEISSALEVLLKELHEQPRHINVSTLRTVAQSVEFMGELFDLCEPRCGDLPAPKILVVDDEVLSRRAIIHALERGHLKSTEIDNPTVALKMVAKERFDLIVLDVQMPDLDGFELCTQIRTNPINQNTPVLFVTSLTDFKNRARATVFGGTDFIAKPFFFIEVTIKATALMLRGRILWKDNAA